MIIASYLLIVALLGVYGWLCAVGAGISLLRLLPTTTLTKQGLKLFTPFWGASNTFLVAGLAGVALLFNRGHGDFRKVLLPSLGAALVALVIRTALVLYLYFGKKPTGLRWYNGLLVLASLVLPLGLGSAGIYLLIGHNFWQTNLGWLFFGSLVLGLLALSITFVYFTVGLTPRARIRDLSRWISALFVTFTAIILQHALIRANSHLISLALVLFMLLMSFMLLWQIGLWYSGQERYLWFYLSAVALVAPIFLALANRPYLLFSKVTLSHAYHPDRHETTITLGLATLLVVLIAGFGLLVWWLLNRAPVKKGATKTAAKKKTVPKTKTKKKKPAKRSSRT